MGEDLKNDGIASIEMKASRAFRSDMTLIRKSLKKDNDFYLFL